MKRNFYLQHPLMAMNDPQMKRLVDAEGLKGVGAYWTIIEKLSLLPESRAQLEYLRPFCNKKVPFNYLKKIILEYDLFVLEDDEFFSAKELNSVKKRQKKAAKNIEESANFETKNDEKQQKTSRTNEENQPEKPDNSHIINSSANHTTNTFKENIKDIITSAAKEKETPAADDDDKSPTVCKMPLTVCDAFGRPQAPLQPIRCWQEMVDQLSERSPWLEVACVQSGYGILLMSHIQEAVGFFKRHIELYDKGHDLLTQSDVRRYFANYVRAGQRTSQALRKTLIALDATKKAADP